MDMPIPFPGLLRDLQILVGNDDSLTVHLFQNSITPTINSVVSDFVECDFSGYAPQAVTYLGPIQLDSLGTGYFQPCGANVWTVATGGSGNMVFGAYVLDSAGRLRACGRLDNAPAPMSVAGQQLTVLLSRQSTSTFASS